jgi:hypothetical protein
MLPINQSTPSQGEQVNFIKITLHFVINVDESERVSVHVFGRWELDYKRSARARYVRTYMASEFPQAWQN